MGGLSGRPFLCAGAPAVKHLYVVTHTQATHHVDGLVGGWYDSELTELGQRQADRVGQRLRALIPDEADIELFSSDLRRAHQTAEAISRWFEAPIRSDPDLREKSYGSAEGKPQAWLAERFAYPAREGDRMGHRDGLPGAESKREFATRIYRVVDRIAARSAEHQVVVTHGFALTFVVAAWIRLPLEAAGYIAVKTTSGGITHLCEDDQFYNRAIMQVNDTGHLP